MTKYNKTQLSPNKILENHVFHRDQFAHVLRWFYVAKIMSKARKEWSVLDYGCGDANLLKLLYHNRCAPANYLGLDVRKQTIEKLKEEWKSHDFARFEALDLCSLNVELEARVFDLIACFEVVEHIGKKNLDQFLKNMIKFCHQGTLILISTPNHDELVGAAKNHVIDGEVSEWKHEELQEVLKKYFTIEDKVGTFASIKDYEPLMNEHQRWVFDELHKYYDSNVMSILFAPMFPEQARNCLWILRSKN